MSDWSPPDGDFDTNMGEGIALGGGRVSPGTQAVRDRAAGALRATFEDNSGLADTVDRQVAKVAGRKAFSPPAQDFAFTPPQSDFQAPAEKSETGPSLMDQFLAPWKGETLKSLYDQNSYVRWRDYNLKVNDIATDIAAKNPGIGPLDLATQATDAYREKFGKPAELSIDWPELPSRLYHQITDRPAEFVSGMVKGLITDPQMFLATASGRAAGQALKLAGQFGAQTLASSGARQLQETGTVQPQAALQEAAGGAAFGGVLSLIHSAANVGLHSIGKEKGAPVTPEVEQEFAKRFDADVQDGMPASQAMAKNMRDAGMDPKEADAMGTAVQRADRAMDEVLRSMEPEQAERRVDTAERARVDEMSPTEMRKALFTDDLTGLPNRRAYAEADKQPITASIDVDGLKWINDNLGHEAGDQLIRQVADALKDHDAYHLSGDEFVAQFPDRDSARAAMQAFQDTLAKSKFEFVTPKGERIVIDGPGATHGIGDTSSAADAALREGKVSKELSGERAARGEAPPRLQRVQPEAVSDAGERSPAGDQVQAADPSVNTAPFSLSEIKSEIGWAETGGRMIRHPVTGEVTGRTKWIPHSDFWQERPVKISERDAHIAVNKAEAGKKLTPNEQKFVDYARETLGKRYDQLPESVREAHEERLAIQQYGRVDPRLLGLIALSGVGAASAYWLTQDSGNKVRNALVAGGLGAAALALGKAGGAAGRLFDGLKDTRYRITSMTDQYGAGVRLGELGSMRLEHALNAILPDVAKRTEVLHAYQSGDTSGLSPVQLKYLDTLKRGFEKGGEMGQAAGVLPEQLLKDYITQLWVRGLNTKDSLIENLKNAFTASAQTSPGMSPKTRFAKQRSIPDYKSGIEAGLVPVTLDPSAILRIYLNNVNKAVQNKKFINAMGNGTDTLGRPLTVKGDVLESMIRQRAMKEMDALPIDGAGKKMVADIAAIKSVDDYTFINHPQLANTKVLSDIAPSVKALFDANDANAATRAAYAVSIAAKRGLFSFSLFHAKSLLDAMLGTPLAGWKHVPGALKMLREGGNAGLDDLVKAGLNVVAKPLEADASAFSNGMRVLEAKMPMAALPIKGVRWMQEHMDHFLWNVVHPSFKVAAALAQYEKQLLKNPKMPREQIAKNVASYANDIFGGLDWFKIADGVQNKYGRDLALALTSPSGRRFMQIAMLAPDWTVATTRAMAKAIPGVSDPMIAAMHRGYVLRSALVYLTVAEGMNQLFSGHHIWENQDPTMVDLGDGRRMQLSKHFMEPVHWLIKPAQQAMNKLGYLPKEFMTQALGTEYLSTKGAPPMDTSAVGRVKHALKGAMPIPSSVAAESGPGPALSGLVGLPIYGKTEQQAIDAAVEKALGVYKQKQEDGAKQRYRSEGQAESAATKRVQKQYQKRRAEQEKRESR